MKTTQFTTLDSRSCQSCQSSWVGGLKADVRKRSRQARGLRKLTLVNVGKNTTLCDSDVSKELVQLLVVPDGELKVAGNDTGLLVVTSGVASQLEDLGREVLKNSGEVDGSTGTDTLSIVALAEKTVDTTDGESETGLGRTTAEEGQFKISDARWRNASRSRKPSSIKSGWLCDSKNGEKGLRLGVLGSAGLAT